MSRYKKQNKTKNKILFSSKSVTKSEPKCQICFLFRGVARAFPGRQNEEENEGNLRKTERKYRKMRKFEENISILPT